jgi:hypothetical protein
MELKQSCSGTELAAGRAIAGIFLRNSLSVIPIISNAWSIICPIYAMFRLKMVIVIVMAMECMVTMMPHGHSYAHMIASHADALPA